MPHVKQFGAIGDGVADDTAAIQAALYACKPNETVEFTGGIHVITATLVIPSDFVHMRGPAKIKAKDGVNFVNMLIGIRRRGCTVRHIEFDANKSGRIVAQGGSRYNGAGFARSSECMFENCVVRNTRGSLRGTSATGLFLGALSERCRIQNCLLFDCGDPDADSDGIFTSGTQNVIANCMATNCTDTAYVLEKSDYGLITGCSAVNCSALAAITNDMPQPRRGNVINGLTGNTRFNGQTGQIQIGCPTSATGDLLETLVSNVTLYCAPSVKGSGPAIAVRQQGGGRAKGVTISNCRIDGATTHGILVDGDGVEIINCHVQRATDHCVAFLDGASGGRVANCSLAGGSFGITARGNAVVVAQNNVISGSRNYAILASDISDVTSIFNIISSPGIAQTEKNERAKLNFIGVERNQFGIGNLHGAMPAGVLVDKFLVANQQGKPIGYVGIYNS